MKNMHENRVISDNARFMQSLVVIVLCNISVEGQLASVPFSTYAATRWDRNISSVITGDWLFMRVLSFTVSW